jgi:hypothetical protein
MDEDNNVIGATTDDKDSAVDNSKNIDKDDDDILNMFSDDEKNKVQKAMDGDDTNTPANRGSVFDARAAVDNALGLKGIFDLMGNSGNTGTGDVATDLMNWLQGADKLPSDPLTELLGNSILKTEFAMLYNIVENFLKMNKLKEFIDAAQEIYFDPDALVGMEPDEVFKRFTTALKMKENLFEMNRRAIAQLKDKQKDNELDKLQILLSAIPTNKLKELIGTINK